MLPRFHRLIGALFFVPAVASAQQDTVLTAALVRAILQPLAADLATGRPAHGDERAGTAKWRVWDVRARAAGETAAAALRDSVFRATGARPWSAGDREWTLLEVDGAEVHGDSAELHIDRGTRWCAAWGAVVASGYTYRYIFRREASEWRYVRVVPYIAYDPPPPPSSPGRRSPECGALHERAPE